MKTTFFASCALAALAVCADGSATEVFVGGNVEFIASNGDVISDPGTTNLISHSDYGNDLVGAKSTTFNTKGDVTVKANTKTRVLEYGAYVNFDTDQTSVNDVDAHVHVRFAQGTFKFGTDIDGLQGAEDLDWVTVGPEGFSNSITAPISTHKFTSGVTKASAGPLGESSITFTSNTINGFSAAAEATNDSSNGDMDWGASLKYDGALSNGVGLKAAVGTESSKAVLANAKLSFADLSIGGMYGADNDDDTYMGGALGYDMGALTMSVGMMEKEAANGTVNETAEQTDMQFGLAYELAPGLTIDGNAIRNKRTTYGDPTLTADRLVGRIKLKF